MTSQTQKKTHLFNNPYLELNNQGQTLRLELTKNEHVLGRDPYKADLLVPQVWQIISSSQAVLRREGEDYWIYDGDGSKPSTNGMFALPSYTQVTAVKGLALRHETELRIGQDPRNQIQLIYFNPASPTAGNLPRTAIALRNRSVLLGRDRNATVQLNSPIVSRRHATIDANAHGQYILTDRSSNGVFVNGKRINNFVVLTEGAKIRIGPFTLIYQAGEITLINPGDALRLEAIELVRDGKNKNNESQRLLDSISLAIEPGNLVALAGTSDANQSILLRTLLGIEPTNRGAVYANGEDLRKHFDSYNSLIGFVPKEDALHGELTVAEALTYAIKLRLPSDANVEQVFKKVLDDIEMFDQRNKLINTLSNSERKRVSIGVELVVDPKLFFLEEPTLGLDPGLEKKMVSLLRKLAEQQRTVIFTAQANTNITICDRLVFLGGGGHLCYFGPPADIHSFFAFHNQDFAAIYSELEKGESIVKLWEDKYRYSSYYQRYIASPLSPQLYQQQAKFAKLSHSARVSPLRQLNLLTQRYFQLAIRDHINFAFGMFAAVIFPILLAAIKNTEPFVFSNNSDSKLAFLAVRFLLLFSLSNILAGVYSSIPEIVKEQVIFRRERLGSIGLFPYVISKLIGLKGLACLQTLVITAVILISFEQPDSDIIAWPIGLAITTFLTLLASMNLGLMVSAFVNNISQAYKILPLILVFQMIFSGVWFKLDSLFTIERLGGWISWLTVSRWSVGAYGSLVNVNAMVAKPIELSDGNFLPQLFDRSAVYEPTWENLALNWAILCLHTVVYFAITFLFQKRKDIFR
ncbi:FHA domain-containing protein [Kamptonema sp. UHCC 0994]|uniref:FHA domain-containing protein n=1 Tax=Kamptonema sp. UHCC 0994 TaxID=3031329 RepID=UPI0023B9F09D|nr:FHA domain-containing protein [Kamptonema sp. UHCC 0994]MDF0552441.1 FHA domain-containing protein [Kamptonema sp. UHCC 0994]